MVQDILFIVLIAIVFIIEKEIQKIMATFADLQAQLTAASTTAQQISAKIDALKTSLAAAQIPTGALTQAETQALADQITALQNQLAAVSASAGV